jgi:predicted house-cleaning NTP pyrophosphatase (Maf/HAM1 superfamily)
MLQHPTPRLILANASASRRAALQAAGLRFATQPVGRYCIDQATDRYPTDLHAFLI